MSKAGVIGQFGNKRTLQLATLDAAVAIFTREVWDSSGLQAGRAGPPARDRPRLDHLPRARRLPRRLLPDRRHRPSSTAAPASFTTRSRVRSSYGTACSSARPGSRVDAGELPAETDPAQIAFEMNAVAMATNQAHQLRGDRHAGTRGRKAMERVLRG